MKRLNSLLFLTKPSKKSSTGLKQAEHNFSEAVAKISKLQGDIQTNESQHKLALARKDIENGKVINRVEAEHQEKIAIIF
ncbi:hypothetical protein [Solibacillus sp. FSL K6-1126]|uniref:hypothetical protein n=1 Tax=Solibacillus sp. FSL K6-1126 TaxID=2921463 RepID=UPI0030F51FFB